MSLELVRTPRGAAPAPLPVAASRSGRSAVRPPPRRPRALWRAGGGLAPRPLAGPVTVRLPLPARIVQLAELGIREPAAQHEGWWRRIEEEMEHFVFRHVPPRAPGLEMSLDPERMEVVVRYRATEAGA